MSADSRLIPLILPHISDLMERLPRFTVDTRDMDEEIMAVFMTQMQMDIDGLRNARTASDLIEVSKRAHSIKGMGGSADMPEVSVLAEELERAAKAGNAERVHELDALLNKCFECVKNKR